MNPGIDASLYPDEEPPEDLATLEDRADYVHRVVGAFDFGLPPRRETLRLLSEWREVFDLFPLPHSPSYHALRDLFGWPPVPMEPFFVEPTYIKLDRLEGREDGFEAWI